MARIPSPGRVIIPSENGGRLMDRNWSFFGVIPTLSNRCLTPNESYIVSGSIDCSIRICDLKTNQAVGDPLLQLHDDRVVAAAMSCDGKYITSAGVDKQIHVWNLEAALKNALVHIRFVVQFTFLTVLAI
jgi:WD40 repeat protein